MPKKLTYKDFLYKAQKTHGVKYIYTNVKYKSFNKKVEIICSIHGSFFQTPASHLKGKGCSKCVRFELEQRPRTLICDIDGTIIKHCGDITKQSNCSEILPGVKEFWKKIDRKCWKIILITGRRESERETTIAMLKKIGIFYDELIMGATSGPRILINDLKPDSTEPMALAVNLIRNKGMMGLDI